MQDGWTPPMTTKSTPFRDSVPSSDEGSKTGSSTVTSAPHSAATQRDEPAVRLQILQPLRRGVIPACLDKPPLIGVNVFERYGQGESTCRGRPQHGRKRGLDEAVLPAPHCGLPCPEAAGELGLSQSTAPARCPDCGGRPKHDVPPDVTSDLKSNSGAHRPSGGVPQRASGVMIREMATKQPSGAKRVRAARTQRLASQRSTESFRAAWRRTSAEVARRDANVLRVLADFDRGVPLPRA